jgi:hypothetical protein
MEQSKKVDKECMTLSVRTLEVAQETSYKVAELMATVKKSQ